MPPPVAGGGAPPGSTTRQQRHDERQPLATSTGFLRKRAVRGRFSQLELLSLVFIPWLIFVEVCCLFTFVYYKLPWVVWGVLALASLACYAQIRQSASEKNRSHFLVVSLSSTAILSAALVGLASYDFALRPFWYYDNLSSYVNVLPSDAAAGYSDAGKLIFAEEAHLDTTRSMGFRDGGAVYCVAPVAGDEMDGHVQFWAAGVNCCGARGSFVCDDAWDSKAKSGIVMGGISSIRGNHRERYMQSVRQAEAAFAIKSADTPLFVHWVVDPEKMQHNYWAVGIGILVVACTAHLVFSCATAGLLHTGLRGLA